MLSKALASVYYFNIDIFYEERHFHKKALQWPQAIHIHIDYISKRTNSAIMYPHQLISKLKNKPTVEPEFTVDVNETWMWNESILKSYLYEFILKQYQTVILRQPVLILLDKYPVHVKIVKELQKTFREKYNVHLSLINCVEWRDFSSPLMWGESKFPAKL